MLNLPMILLGMTRIVDRRRCVHTPLLLRSSRRARASKVGTYRARTIRAITTPLGLTLRTA